MYQNHGLVNCFATPEEKRLQLIAWKLTTEKTKKWDRKRFKYKGIHVNQPSVECDVVGVGSHAFIAVIEFARDGVIKQISIHASYLKDMQRKKFVPNMLPEDEIDDIVAA